MPSVESGTVFSPPAQKPFTTGSVIPEREAMCSDKVQSLITVRVLHSISIFAATRLRRCETQDAHDQDQAESNSTDASTQAFLPPSLPLSSYK